MRTASISFKQAIGILVLAFAAICLFADICVFIISIFDWLVKSQKFQGIPSIIGLFIGAFLVFIFVIILVVFGIWLVRDKNGFDWKNFGKG